MQVGSVQGGAGSVAIQAARTSPFVAYDPADTNQDGTVSPSEALAYSLSHPLQSLLGASNQGGTAGPAHQASGASRPSALATHAPADTNRDGVVSGLEALTYSLRHPVAGPRATPAPVRAGLPGLPAPYAPAAAPNGTVPRTSPFLDLNA